MVGVLNKVRKKRSQPSAGARTRPGSGYPVKKENRKYGNLPVQLRAVIAYEAIQSPLMLAWHGKNSWGKPPRWLIRHLGLRPGQLLRRGIVSLYIRLSWVLFQLNGTVIRRNGYCLKTALGYTVNALRHHLCSPYQHTLLGMRGLALAYRSCRGKTVRGFPRVRKFPRHRSRWCLQGGNRIH